MQKYAKYLKGKVMNKTKLNDVDMMELTKECRLVMIRKMSTMLKDPRNFTLNIQIGDSNLVYPFKLFIGEHKHDASIYLILLVWVS